MAVAGARLHASSDTEQDVRAALSARPLLVRSATVPASATLSEALDTPAGLVATDLDHGVHLLDATSLQQTNVTAAGGAEGDFVDVPVALSRRLHVLAVGSQRPDPLPVRLLDPTTMQLLPQQLPGLERQDTVEALSVSGNGRYLAASLGQLGPDQFFDSGRVLVWDLRTRQVVRRLPQAPSAYEAVALDRTGRRAYEGAPLRAYDVTTGRRLWRRPGPGSDAQIAVRPDRRLVAQIDPDDYTVVDVLDAGSGQVVHRLGGFQNAITGLAFSHDGTRLAASANDGLAMVWDTHSWNELDRIQVGGGAVKGPTFSLNDETLYTLAEPSHQVSAWDLTGRRTYVTRLPVTGPSSAIGNGRVSPDGERAAMIQNTDQGKIWKLVDIGEDTTRPIESPHVKSWAAASWAPDSASLALGWAHGAVDLVDGHTGRRLLERKVLHGMVAEVSFSRDGRYLEATDLKGDVVRLDPKTLQQVGPTVKVPFEPESLASSPDGRYAFVLTAGEPARYYWNVPFNRYYLVDLQRHRIVRTGDAGVANGFYCDFSPDGRHVTVGGRDGQVSIIDVTTGTVVRPRLGSAYSGVTDSVRYNRTGSEVVPSSGGGHLAVLDGRTGELLAMASLAASELQEASNFAPDGTVVVSTWAGHVFRWNPSPQHALTFACSVTGRGLDRAEWSAVLPGESWRQTCPT